MAVTIIPVLNQIQTIKLVDGINRDGITNEQWGIHEFNTEWNTAEEFYTDPGCEQHNYKLPAGTYMVIYVFDDEDYQIGLTLDAVKKNGIPYVKVQNMDNGCNLMIFRLSTND